MSYTLWDATLVLAKLSLASLTDILKKGEAATNADQLPAARLYPDMEPLTFQVHVACDLCQRILAHTAGTEPLTLVNDIKTFPDMFKRIAEVQELLEKADKELVDGRDGQNVVVPMGPGRNIDMSIKGFTNGFAMPHLFFHLTTAYDILRKEGVPLGKRDYAGPFMGAYLDLSALE
ncbi:hypothetical protein HIM_00163 [Hirsutella minnesotensis 3608]|nr:hypothetical protein HIM_00163 [Hirsutella minnesotensis 3608]